MNTDRLLTEIERQRKYLERLPDDFSYPLFNSKQALESQRRNGYRNTASAAREIVDNALEAGATKIHVAFERPQRTQAFERADSVSAVAFIDDGSGMLPEMARFALSWGGGTHFDDPSFIGKFGFGLPNASINQTRRVEVYTRTKSDGPIFMATLDASTVSPHGVQTIAAPVEAELPAFVQRYLHDNKLAFEHGTVVVWVKPDRLTYRMAASLREHLVDDFGVTYRYLLDKGNGQAEVDLSVERTRVKPVDPLFLDPSSRYYLPPEEGGAQEILNVAISVKYFRDEETGALHAAKIQEPEEIDPSDPNLLAVGAINVRIARLPFGFAEHKNKKSKGEPTDANRRFEIRKARRGMSFVRAGREIETVDVFPRTPRDISSGLGDWPLLQAYAYHWGVEVRFEPTLDDIFGITNDKQTVRPIEDFWRILASEEIDKALNRENNWQAKERRDRRQKRAEGSPGPTPAENAAGTADAVAGQKPDVPDGSKSKATERLEDEATKRAAQTEKSITEARDALLKEAKYRPYRIDYRDVPSGPFYDHEWVGSQLVILINRLHPFYTTFYADLLQLRGGERAKEAVDVLLIALAKGEATMDEESQAKLWYETQRIEVWSTFLSRALRALAQSLRAEDDDDADGEDDEPTGQVAPVASSA